MHDVISTYTTIEVLHLRVRTRAPEHRDFSSWLQPTESSPQTPHLLRLTRFEGHKRTSFCSSGVNLSWCLSHQENTQVHTRPRCEDSWSCTVQDEFPPGHVVTSTVPEAAIVARRGPVPGEVRGTDRGAMEKLGAFLDTVLALGSPRANDKRQLGELVNSSFSRLVLMRLVYA